MDNLLRQPVWLGRAHHLTTQRLETIVIIYDLMASFCRNLRQRTAGTVCSTMFGVTAGRPKAVTGTEGLALKVVHWHGGRVGASPCGPLHGAAEAPQELELTCPPTEVTRRQFCSLPLVTRPALIHRERGPLEGVNTWNLRLQDAGYHQSYYC